MGSTDYEGCWRPSEPAVFSVQVADEPGQEPSLIPARERAQKAKRTLDCSSFSEFRCPLFQGAIRGHH